MRRLLMTLGLFVILAGCGDPGIRIVLEVDESVELRRYVDLLEVDVVATKSRPEPDRGFTLPLACQTVTRVVSEQTHPGLLPLTIIVRPGEDDWECVVVRVRGLPPRGDAMRTIREFITCTDIEEGVTELRYELPEPCLEVFESCGEADVCDPIRRPENMCQPSKLRTAFEDGTVPRSCDVEP